MHRSRNSSSWSELKAKRNRGELDDAPSKVTNFVQDDVVNTSQTNRKEKNDRATRQLDGVKNMFKDMADYDFKQNKSGQK